MFTTYKRQTESVQDAWYWAYNALQKRFQEYAPDYQTGQQVTDLLDLSTIKEPKISFFVGEKDIICPLATAKTIKDDIGDAVTYMETITGEGHTYFASANSDDFITKLVEQLKNDGAYANLAICTLGSLLTASALF